MYSIKEDSGDMSNNKNISLGKDNYAISSQAMQINADSMNLDTLNKIVKMCSNSDYYHEFNISGCIKNDRHSILRTLLDFVKPISFIAVSFIAIGNTECKFLAKNCLDFMMKIIANKFRVPLPDGSGMLMFDIQANFIPSMYIKMDQVRDISSNLKRRIDNSSSTINLNNFCEDETLLFYYPLYDSRTMLDLTCFISSYQPKKLLLQNNWLKDVNSIYPLKKTDLVHLDLQNNQISSLEDLECLKHFLNLKHLLLNGNPICQLYNSYNYVLDIKGICKSLEKLDNIDVNSVPAFHKNFFCNEEGEDLGGQFLEHFFTVYDSNRSALSHLYDKDAIVSVCSKIRDFQITSETAKLHHYGLKKPFIVVGSNVMKLWDELPETIHDPYTFVCDVTSCNAIYGSISVNGIFWERNQILFFSRNFLLKRREDEFSIINDQLFVTNPTDIQIGYSFRFPRPNSFHPYFGDQYKDMENVLRAITRMNSNFCRAILDMCGYDLKKSLEYFKEDLKTDDVPKEAFIPDSLTHNDSQNNAYSGEIVKKTKEAFSTVNSKTVWETYNKQRFNQSLRTTPIQIDHTIDRIYPKIRPYKKIDKLINKYQIKPVSKASAPSRERKPIQIHLKGSTIPQTEQSTSATPKNNSNSLRLTIRRKKTTNSSSVKPDVDVETEQSKPENLSARIRKKRLRSKYSVNYENANVDSKAKGTNTPTTKPDVVEVATTTPRTEQSKPTNPKNISTSLVSTLRNKPQISRWSVNTNLDSKRNSTNTSSKERDVVKIANKVARNLRLKEIKKQIEKENSLSVISTESKNQQKQDSKQIKIKQCSSVTSASNTTISKEKQDPSKSTVTSSTKPASTPVVTSLVVTTPVVTTPVVATPVVATPMQLPNIGKPNKGKPVPGKKINRQTHIITEAEAQALAYRMLTPQPIPPFQQHGLGIIPQDLISAHAQTMMSVQRQALSHNFIHPNWQALTANMGALGIPEVLPNVGALGIPEVPNMMAHHGNMLNVPNTFTIPDNIVGVPEILRMQAELFNSSPPIANEVHLAPFIFNIDDFEPPKFRPSKKPVAAKTSQQTPKRQVVTPPPGVDVEEYLTELNANANKGRKEVDSEPNNKTNVQETIDLTKENPPPSKSDVHSEVGKLS